MAEALDPQEDVAEDDFTEEPQQNTLLAALRKKYEQLGDVAYLDYSLPGWDDILKVRFNNSMTWVEITNIIKRAEKDRKSPYATLWAQCDILINCTDSIWARESTDKPWGRLDKADGSGPVGWTTDLAQMFGIQGVSTAREVIRKIFKLDLRLAATQAAVMEWIQKIDADAGEEVAGES